MNSVRMAESSKLKVSASLLRPADFRRARYSCRRRIEVPAAAALIVAALGWLLQPTSADAVEFGNENVWGRLDTTISHGLTFRIGKRDPRLTSGINGNDGNLNYGRGLVSNTSKFTIDLDINTHAFGAFFRATGFLDFENQNSARDRTPLSKEALAAVGKDIELLDAYVTTSFDAGDTPVDLRLGKHVLNWGESTFIPNGISEINPFDVSKLRLPGSELREALLPVPMVSFSASPNYTTTIEGFYQLDWAKTRIDPVGSFFFKHRLRRSWSEEGSCLPVPHSH